MLSVVLIPRNRRPQTALAWLLAIFFIPYLGIALFLLLGTFRLPKRRRDKQVEINQYILDTTEGFDRVAEEAPWPDWLAPIVELNRTLGAMPMVGGNSAVLYDVDAAALAAMTEDDRRAQRGPCTSSSTSSRWTRRRDPSSTPSPPRCDAESWCGFCSITSAAGSTRDSAAPSGP